MKFVHTTSNSRGVLQRLVYMFQSITCIPRVEYPPGALRVLWQASTKRKNIKKLLWKVLNLPFNQD